MSTRSDPHRPSDVDPADYRLVCQFDDHHEDGYAYWLDREMELNEADKFIGHYQGNGYCDVCGTGSRIRYGFIFYHTPSAQTVVVGSECAALLGLSSKDQAEQRKVREAARITAKRDEWLAADADHRLAYDWAKMMVELGQAVPGYRPSDGWRAKFVTGVDRYGYSTEKFVASILRDRERTLERAALDAERKATRCPVIAGDGIEIAGEVLSVKLHESDFGDRIVMTVKDDRGFLVWGSRPAGISSVEVGDRVGLVANVEVSEKDETFGFFKRPRKAAYLDSELSGLSDDEVGEFKRCNGEREGKGLGAEFMHQPETGVVYLSAP